MHADDIGGEEIYRLAEHAGFGFDASDTPRDHADAVDHGGVRIRAHQRIRVIEWKLSAVLPMHASSEVFEIDLVHDAYPRGDDLESVKRLHTPLHEFVAFGIALEFDLHIEIERVFRAVVVDLHRVIDDEIDRDQRLDQLGVSAHALRDPSHRGEIAQQRHAGKVLKHDPGDDERDFVGARCGRCPARELADVILGDFLAVAVAQY